MNSCYVVAFGNRKTITIRVPYTAYDLTPRVSTIRVISAGTSVIVCSVVLVLVSFTITLERPSSPTFLVLIILAIHDKSIHTAFLTSTSGMDGFNVFFFLYFQIRSFVLDDHGIWRSFNLIFKEVLSDMELQVWDCH